MQRFPISASGLPTLALAGGSVLAPAVALYVRFIQDESWTVSAVVAGAIALLAVAVAVWERLMRGKAIELTDDAIAFPRAWSSRPEVIQWSWIEAGEGDFSPTADGPDRYLVLTYLGGRRRRISLGSFLDADGLERAIRDAVAKHACVDLPGSSPRG
nr:hypothetical protein [Kofleriaceae bacterium]